MFEEIIVETVVNPTESVEKVTRALKNLFPTMTFSIEQREDKLYLVGKTADKKALHRIYELIRGQAILDTARQFLEDGLFGEEIIIRLNKQAAYAGRVNFNDEVPLGYITVVIKTKNPRRLLKWLAPRTKDGIPVE